MKTNLMLLSALAALPRRLLGVPPPPPVRFPGDRNDRKKHPKGWRRKDWKGTARAMRRAGVISGRQQRKQMKALRREMKAARP